MALEFIGSGNSSVSRDVGEILVREFMFKQEDTDFGIITVCPDAKPPFSQILTLIPEVTFYTETYQTPHEARLVASRTAFAEKLFFRAQERRSRVDHPTARRHR